MKNNISEKVYIAIDLKSFYASAECVERGLNPLDTNLVVADESRTEKTICLAVSPSLKAYGIPGRARLFEVVEKVKQVNSNRLDDLRRKTKQPGIAFKDKSYIASELKVDESLELSYIAAPPRMALYMQYSSRIYDIYLKYVAPEDIHVYSVDEVFMDVTAYLNTYKMTPHELARTMIMDVLDTTGITATAGIGTNMYLCKVAMDVEAKHIEPDKDGVRIAYLDEMTYRKSLWTHTPITDFWRVGRGYAKKLADYGMFTMGDVARCSIGKQNDFYNEDLLYRLFGINAELLIDHAWGYEPTTIDLIKQYKPESNSLSTGQVLQHPYDAEKTKLIVKEMTDLLVLDLVDKGLVTDQIVLTIGYDIENLKNKDILKKYDGEITEDRYGRRVPKHAHGTTNLKMKTSSTKIIMEATLELFDKIMDKDLFARRINVVAARIAKEEDVDNNPQFEQLDLFTDYETLMKEKKEEELELAKEKKIQHALLDIKKKYGKNAIVKGMNLEDGATTIQRNAQIGGHKA